MKTISLVFLGILTLLAIIAVIENGWITGAITGTAQANVQSTVQITLTTDTVDFGTVNNNDVVNTTGNSSKGFYIQNDGNVRVNVTIKATDLWTTVSNPSSYYMFAVNGTTEGICYDETNSVTTYTNMPNDTTPTLAIARLNFTNSCDTAKVEIGIVVPSEEPAGAKSSTVTFTGSQA